MMPTPTLTDVDLTDPTPPVPGERERSAVRTRAAQITRRRRFAVGAGMLGVAVIAILGAVVFTGGSSGTGTITASIVVVQSGSPVEASSTVTLDLKNADGSFSGQADASGTVQFGEDITPGRYDVFITVDSAPAQPTDGIDIGSARTTYRPFSMTLDAGVNTIDLNTLTPATTP
jgi:hypothetical protein